MFSLDSTALQIDVYEVTSADAITGTQRLPHQRPRGADLGRDCTERGQECAAELRDDDEECRHAAAPGEQYE